MIDDYGYRGERIAPEARCWLLGLSGGIVLLYCWFFVASAGKVGPADHDQFLVFHELQYWNAAFFGIAKQWTPLLCSGLSLAGEPQVPFMSLSMALAYLLGPFWALKAATVLYFIAGWCGAGLYAGLWLEGIELRALAASLFIGNGFFICRLGYGHIDFIPFLILPLALWMLHRAGPRVGGQAAGAAIIRVSLAMLLLAALFALAVDGSPVAIIHLLVWIGLYAGVLGIVARSVWPPVLFAGALLIAALLDAGYLWPMLQAQSLHPRRTPDTFTSIFSLLWFALIPMRGKVLPANGNGHELSVFIGPVLLWLLWRERDWLRASMPPVMRAPLLWVGMASIVLGMGSLKSLHIPSILSPFDLLRPWPGFRSIGVTGRFWGFLALPLSLAGAAVLWRFCARCTSVFVLRIVLGSAIILQLGFQAGTVFDQWMRSRDYHGVNSASFRGPEQIHYVNAGDRQQGEFITPTRGVSDCYDMDDFVRAENTPGTLLIKRIQVDSGTPVDSAFLTGSFATWSDIQLAPRSAIKPQGDRIRVVLRQAYHPYWSAPGCLTQRTERGNLLLDCPTLLLLKGPLRVRFNDLLSDTGAEVSRRAWLVWPALLGILTLLRIGRVRARRVPSLPARSQLD